MRAVGKADRPGRPADLLHGDAVVHVTEPEPSVLLWRGEAVQVEVPHELPQIHLLGEVVGGVDPGGVRRDVLLREPVHALLELLLGVVEEEGGGGREPAARGGCPASGGGRAAEEGRQPALHRGGARSIGRRGRKEEEEDGRWR